MREIENTQVDGYIIKLTTYVLGNKDVHILLTSTDAPDFVNDEVYEFGECVQYSIWVSSVNLCYVYLSSMQYTMFAFYCVRLLCDEYCECALFIVILL